MTERTLQQCWVAAVIRDEDGNILVARSADTQAWDLPGGPLRVGEDVCTAVHRVVADSVTLGVSVGWMSGIHSHVRDGVTLIFLARHVTGRASAKGDVQLCRWVAPDVAVRMLWPRRSEQLRGALRAQHPQPVVVYGLPRPGRRGLGDTRSAVSASCAAS